MPDPTLAATILMVRPARFGFDRSTAETNAFQRDPGPDPHLRALAEFDRAVEVLASQLDVVVVDEPKDDPCPDAVFPNNWFASLPGGRVCLFPMRDDNRQREVRPQLVLDSLKGFEVTEVVDFREAGPGALEGTGSLVLDHRLGVAYACVSPRTTPELVEKWCERFGFRPFLFELSDRGVPVYHTNVVMAVGPSAAVIDERVLDVGDLRESLQASGRTVVGTTPEQTAGFGANVLFVSDATGRPVLVCSDRARRALGTALHQFGTTVLTVEIPTIESVGGGSARCMIAEVFLERLTRTGWTVTQ